MLIQSAAGQASDSSKGDDQRGGRARTVVHKTRQDRGHIQQFPVTGKKGDQMKAGFIGLGIMGRPMAKNLLKAGVEVVCADLNKDAVADVVANGGKEASYAEIGAECPVIITMVPNGDIVKSILFGEGGVASTIKAGALVCDMSSVTPVESQYCYVCKKEVFYSSSRDARDFRRGIRAQDP